MAPSSDEAMAALASIGIDVQTITGSRYPNQSKGDDGLPAYVDGESIAEADLVA